MVKNIINYNMMWSELCSSYGQAVDKPGKKMTGIAVMEINTGKFICLNPEATQAGKESVNHCKNLS